MYNYSKEDCWICDVTETAAIFLLVLILQIPVISAVIWMIMQFINN